MIGIPCVAVAVILLVLGRSLMADRRMTGGILWWILLVLPLGSVLITIPAMLAYPEYFEAESTGALIGAIALMCLIAAIGVLLGPIVWFFLFLPLDLLFGTVATIIRGEKGVAWKLWIPSCGSR